MLTIETLQAYGANTKEGLGRCFGKEDLYLRLVKMIPGQEGFGNLEKAIETGDSILGFEAAHALKGVLGNLSLTPLMTPVNEATEILREGKDEKRPELIEAVKERGLYEEIVKQKKALETLISE